jgi:hypothetical protein
MAFNLMATLGLNIGPFKRGLDQAGASLRSSGAQFAQSLKGSVAGLFSVAAITGAARASIQYAGQIKDLADQFSLTNAEVQKLQYLADGLGLEFNRVGMALDQLGEARQKALTDPKIAEQFQRLGVALTDVANPAISSLALMESMSTALRGMPLTEAREALGDLVGSRGQRLLELVKQLSDAAPIKLLDDATIEKADKLESRFDQIWKRIKAIGAAAVVGAVEASDFRVGIAGPGAGTPFTTTPSRSSMMSRGAMPSRRAFMSPAPESGGPSVRDMVAEQKKTNQALNDIRAKLALQGL